MKVIKFGGTSIGTPERFLETAKIISEKAGEGRIVLVLSAIGGITDKIISAISLASSGDKDYQRLFGEIKAIHTEFLNNVTEKSLLSETERKLSVLFTTLFEKLRGVFLLGECSARVSDSIITLGEYFSNHLMVSTLNSIGRKACFYDAREFIKTDSLFGDAAIIYPITNRLIKTKFDQVQPGVIPVVNGFTGSDEDGQITSLGRSGSDFTATIIGGALGAELVEIWTDVAGVLSADPKMVGNAHTLDHLSYSEAGSLAILGGKVIHPKTIAPVEKKNVPIKILNTFRPDGRGTHISRAENAADRGIKTITYLNGITIVTVDDLETRYTRKILFRLFSIIAKLDLPVISVNVAATQQSISFVIQTEYSHNFLEEIQREFVLEQEKGYIGEVSGSVSLSLISAIGCSPEFYSPTTRRIYDTLERERIPVNMFLNTPKSADISFLLNRSFVQKAVSSLHDEFFVTEVVEIN